jgi:tRNA(fMet)-specific endonuclease VapC
MYMLDTNILIFAMRHPDSICAGRIALHTGDDLCISVVTYAELEYGIENSSNPERNRAAVMRILAGIRILNFDLLCAVHFGRILASLKKRNVQNACIDRDKMIAAHAKATGNILVTDNLKHFCQIEDLTIENWREDNDLV